MKIGVTLFVTDETPSPDAVASLVEQYRFESLWLPDHTHIPSRRESPHPVTRDRLAREYSRNLDVFIALTAAAMATKDLRIGTGVCLVTERDPIVTAKQVATLDLLSQGRVLFGVGAGWNLEELRNHGVEPQDRFKLLEERIESMKAIWTQDEASFKGKFVSFDSIWSWPKPVQKPHPTILLGANGPRAVERAARIGAHWLPATHRDDNALLARIAEYERRTDGQLGVTLSAPPLHAKRLARFADAGVDRSFFFLPSANASEIERQLEAIEKVTSQI
jgi:probable F420-dependent oxidoreductase